LRQEEEKSEQLKLKLTQIERQLNEQINALKLDQLKQDQKIQHLEIVKVKELAEHSRLVGKITSQQNETQNKLNIEEKERNLHAMKLQQMIATHRNMLAQKKFLKNTISKSLGNIQAEIRKGQLEYRQVGLINVKDAQDKLQVVFALTQQTLEEVVQVIEFMSVDERSKVEELRESKVSSKLSQFSSRLSQQIESRNERFE